MKTTILPSFSRSFSVASTALILLAGACDQGADGALVERDGFECSPEQEPTEAETLAYSKEIVVSDGHNEVRLLVASQDESLLKQYSNETFELVPVFERPDVPASEDHGEHEDALEPVPDFSDSVLIEERSVSLEDGAVGYELRRVDSGFRDAIWTCTGADSFTSTADFAMVDTTSGPCTEARISTKLWSWTWFAEKVHDTNLCPNDAPIIGGKSNTNRVRVEYCPGPGITITTFN